MTRKENSIGRYAVNAALTNARCEHSKKENTTPGSRNARIRASRSNDPRIRASRSNGPHKRPRREPEGPRRGITTIR